jgi:N-acetylneuraminic acid mutarotase
MDVARAGHTATRLPDGTVLVAGGYDSDGDALASTEVYDSGTGSWTATGYMDVARAGHTATLLTDGTVLVVGGYDSGGDTLASAELYDLRSASWTATGNMGEGRRFHTATLLPDGTVLVAGGWSRRDSDGKLNPLASAEVYDPGSRSWTATGNMNEARYQQTATLLPDGDVLLAGGDIGSGLFSGGQHQLASAELYDPRSGSWTATGNMDEARARHTATLQLDGSVLVAGGNSGRVGVSLDSAELYDPNSGSWTATGNMDEARQTHAATLLPDGTVIVAGGSTLTDTLFSAEVYDPSSGSWIAIGNMDGDRADHTATLLPDGTVLVAGGFGSGDIHSLASAEFCDPRGGP